MKDKLPDMFRLNKGRWEIVYRDGRRDIVESDGTREVDFNFVLFVWACLPPTSSSGGNDG